MISRRVDVNAIEIARMEKRLSVMELSIKAGIDPVAYRNLIRYRGARSREKVIFQIIDTLGLEIRRVVSFPGGEEAAA